MYSTGDTNINLICPNPKCKKSMSVKVSDIITWGKISCSGCSSEIALGSSAINELKTAVSELDKAKEKLAAILKQILIGAQVKTRQQ